MYKTVKDMDKVFFGYINENKEKVILKVDQKTLGEVDNQAGYLLSSFKKGYYNEALKEVQEGFDENIANIIELLTLNIINEPRPDGVRDRVTGTFYLKEKALSSYTPPDSLSGSWGIEINGRRQPLISKVAIAPTKHKLNKQLQQALDIMKKKEKEQKQKKKPSQQGKVEVVSVQ